MKYLHVKNLEKYHPNYKDRNLIWCKTYFTMLNSDYEFQKIDDIDRWRLIAFIMLEIQMQHPIPYDEKWLLERISLCDRPISLTIKMLHNFIDCVSDISKVRSVEKSRVEKSRVEKIYSDLFESLWEKYPTKDGKKEAYRHFASSVTSDQDCESIKRALENYLASERVKNGYVKNGSTWFNNWRDWINNPETLPQEKVISDKIKSLMI